MWGRWKRGSLIRDAHAIMSRRGQAQFQHETVERKKGVVLSPFGRKQDRQKKERTRSHRKRQYKLADSKCPKFKFDAEEAGSRYTMPDERRRR
jgi:hypothetical protein